MPLSERHTIDIYCTYQYKIYEKTKLQFLSKLKPDARSMSLILHVNRGNTAVSHLYAL